MNPGGTPELAAIILSSNLYGFSSIRVSRLYVLPGFASSLQKTQCVCLLKQKPSKKRNETKLYTSKKDHWMRAPRADTKGAQLRHTHARRKNWQMGDHLTGNIPPAFHMVCKFEIKWGKCQFFNREAGILCTKARSRWSQLFYNIIQSEKSGFKECFWSKPWNTEIKHARAYGRIFCWIVISSYFYLKVRIIWDLFEHFKQTWEEALHHNIITKNNNFLLYSIVKIQYNQNHQNK